MNLQLIGEVTIFVLTHGLDTKYLQKPYTNYAHLVKPGIEMRKKLNKLGMDVTLAEGIVAVEDWEKFLLNITEKAITCRALEPDKFPAFLEVMEDGLVLLKQIHPQQVNYTSVLRFFNSNNFTSKIKSPEQFELFCATLTRALPY